MMKYIMDNYKMVNAKDQVHSMIKTARFYIQDNGKIINIMEQAY